MSKCAIGFRFVFPFFQGEQLHGSGIWLPAGLGHIKCVAAWLSDFAVRTQICDAGAAEKTSEENSSKK